MPFDVHISVLVTISAIIAVLFGSVLDEHTVWFGYEMGANDKFFLLILPLLSSQGIIYVKLFWDTFRPIQWRAGYFVANELQTILITIGGFVLLGLI